MGRKTSTLDYYKQSKIRMLTKQFLVKLTPEQEEYINSLQSEIAIDNYARSLMY